MEIRRTVAERHSGAGERQNWGRGLKEGPEEAGEGQRCTERSKATASRPESVLRTLFDGTGMEEIDCRASFSPCWSVNLAVWKEEPQQKAMKIQPSRG